MYVITGAATFGDECSELRVDSASGWGVEAAWWGDDAVVTRSGGLSKGARGHNSGVFYLIYVYVNESNISLGLCLQVRRARDALGLWGPPGAGKAACVGFWGSSICVGVVVAAGPSIAKKLL